MKHNDIGFVLIKLFNNKLYDTICSTISEFIKRRPYNQHIIFNSYSERINTMNIPMLHLHQAQFFTGKLVLFDIPSVLFSYRFPNVTQRILYSNELPWAKTTDASYEQWRSVYLQDNLDLVVGNRVLYDIYNICWKQPLGIAEQFNYDQLQQYL